jgi:hypothetical protein
MVRVVVPSPSKMALACCMALYHRCQGVFVHQGWNGVVVQVHEGQLITGIGSTYLFIMKHLSEGNVKGEYHGKCRCGDDIM